MKLLFFFFTIISANTIPFCIHCKFYKKSFFTPTQFGKCLLFPIENENVSFAVNGKKDHSIDYYYCSTARKYMCKNAEFFEKK
jgi:hypothetical protein